MKILELCMSKGFGGLELYALKVIRHLADTGRPYEVISRKNAFLASKLNDENLHHSTFSFVFHHLPLISAIRLAWFIRQKHINVIHVHWAKDLFFAVLAKKFSLSKVKIVFTRQMALTRRKGDFYHRFLYRNIDAYLVITQALYNDAIKYLPIKKENIHLLYYGVPSSDGNKDKCDEYLEAFGLDTEKFRLAIFGRIEEGKGQHLAVDAISRLKQKGICAQLGIIGHVMDKSYFSLLEKTIEQEGLEEDIRYLGFHNNPTDIMPCFNAVVLATKCETFGLVLPEAMRAGVAVIGSNCGGVPEIIEHEKTGLLFETQNSDDLANQIQKMVTDKDYTIKLAKAGKKKADEQFDEEKHFAALLEYFELHKN